jgi:hypothetical protein
MRLGCKSLLRQARRQRMVAAAIGTAKARHQMRTVNGPL